MSMMWWSTRNLPENHRLAPWMRQDSQDLTMGPYILVLFEGFTTLYLRLEKPQTTWPNANFRSVEQWLHYVMASFVLDHDDAPPLGDWSCLEGIFGQVRNLKEASFYDPVGLNLHLPGPKIGQNNPQKGKHFQVSRPNYYFSMLCF